MRGIDALCRPLYCSKHTSLLSQVDNWQHQRTPNCCDCHQAHSGQDEKLLARTKYLSFCSCHHKNQMQNERDAELRLACEVGQLEGQHVKAEACRLALEVSLKACKRLGGSVLSTALPWRRTNSQSRQLDKMACLLRGS